MRLPECHRFYPLFGCLLAGALGCPSRTPTPIEIREVLPASSPPAVRYDFTIAGRGFGVADVAFDVSSGKGSARTHRFSLEIVDSMGTKVARVPSDAITVESPKQMTAHVTLAVRATPGAYGIRLFLDSERTPATELQPAFEVRTSEGGGDDEPLDGGTIADAAHDSGPSFDAAPGSVDAAPAGDAGPPDGSDSGGPSDSGLGPFIGAFQARRSVSVSSTVEAPAGTTIRIPIPHQDLIAETATSARADGRDLSLYLGSTPLRHQFEDRFSVGTNNLNLIARIPVALPAGSVAITPPIVLYYGDPSGPATTTDSVFEFAEHFGAPLASPWVVNTWQSCNLDRPVQSSVTPGASICAFDDTAGLSRTTLATPPILTIASPPPLNTVYEISFWTSGTMGALQDDIFYMAHHSTTDSYELAREFPPQSYVLGAPSAQLTFEERNLAGLRTVSGWRFPSQAIEWWQERRARFTPEFNQPSVHFRYVTLAGAANAATFVSVDDLQIRAALNPDFSVTLGPLERR